MNPVFQDSRTTNGRLLTHTVLQKLPNALPMHISVVAGLAGDTHLKSWQRIHRTRQGAHIPATACPAGANTLITVVSGTLEVLVYSPADSLPWLRPSFGNAPCPPPPPPPSSPPSSPWDERGRKVSRSDVDGDTQEDQVPETRSLLDGGSTADKRDVEVLTSPKQNPRVLLEEVLGLKGGRMGDQDLSPAHERVVGRTAGDDKDNTKSQVTDREVQQEEAGATDNESNDNSGRSPHSSDILYWPHEPRYCAHVWQKYDSRDDGTVTRFVEVHFPILLACLGAGNRSQGWYH